MPDRHPNLDIVRGRLRRALPGVKSSHVAEAVARSLGHGSNAALLASFADGPETVWRVDGPAFVRALAGFGYPDVSPYDVSLALSQAPDSVTAAPGAPSPVTSFPTFARYVSLNQMPISTVVALLFPGRFEPSALDGLDWGPGGVDWGEGGEPWRQVALDCFTLGIGRGSPEAARRVVGWCVLSRVLADATGSALRHEPDFSPVAGIVDGGWKAAFRGTPAPRSRAWDDETDHDAGLPSLRLPWPGLMGAEVPFEGAFRFAAAALRSDVQWFPDAPAGPRLFLRAYGHGVALPDDPVFDAAMRPLLATGRSDLAAEAPGVPGGRLRIQVLECPDGRRVSCRFLPSQPLPFPR